jgi:hypothetical protein
MFLAVFRSCRRVGSCVLAWVESTYVGCGQKSVLFVADGIDSGMQLVTAAV